MRYFDNARMSRATSACQTPLLLRVALVTERSLTRIEASEGPLLPNVIARMKRPIPCMSHATKCMSYGTFRIFRLSLRYIITKIIPYYITAYGSQCTCFILIGKPSRYKTRLHHRSTLHCSYYIRCKKESRSDTSTVCILSKYAYFHALKISKESHVFMYLTNKIT